MSLVRLSILARNPVGKRGYYRFIQRTMKDLDESINKMLMENKMNSENTIRQIIQQELQGKMFAKEEFEEVLKRILEQNRHQILEETRLLIRSELETISKPKMIENAFNNKDTEVSFSRKWWNFFKDSLGMSLAIIHGILFGGLCVFTSAVLFHGFYLYIYNFFKSNDTSPKKTA